MKRQRIGLKFGGTSVADDECLRTVALRVQEYIRDGYDVFVVVSAQGITTDTLLTEAYRLDPNASRREVDQLITTGEIRSAAKLAIVLCSMGMNARSFTGQQAGIATDGVYGASSVVAIDPTPIQQAWRDNVVPVIAGFQGVCGKDITAFKRGGSETTLVDMAYALDVPLVVVFKDVEGIYTARPSEVSHAIKLSRLSHAEMVELARNGTEAIALEAADAARQHNVAILVRSTFSPEASGTLISFQSGTSRVVVGISTQAGYIKITPRDSTPAGARELLVTLDQAGVSVDMSDGVSVTAMSTYISERVLSLVPAICEQTIPLAFTKITLVGEGMRENSGVLADVRTVVEAQLGVRIHLLTTSEIAISILVESDVSKAVVRALHAHFFSS